MVQELIVAFIILNMYGIIRKKNNWFVILLSSIVIYVIMGFNSFTTDYPFYESYYKTQNFSMDFEMGFVVLSELIYWMGLDYQGFLLIYFAICLSVFAFAIKGLDVNVHAILLLYLMTQMFMDINEIRQTMAYFCFAYIIKNYTKYNNRLKYVFYIIAASFFHRSILLFLPTVFIVGRKGISEKKLKVFFIIIAVCCIGVFVNGNRIPGLNLILIALGLGTKAVYFESSTQYGFLLMWAAYFSNLFVVYLAKRKINKHPYLYDGSKGEYISILWKVLLYSAFAMPLCMLNSEFIRCYQFTVVPVIIVMAMMINKKVYIDKMNLMRIVPYNLCLYLYLVIYSFTYQHWRIVEEVIDNNLINDLF